MNGLSSPSLFSFDDLSQPLQEVATACFVNLFAVDKPGMNEDETVLEQPDGASSAEDQARKVFEDAYVQGEKAGFEMGMRRVESIGKRLEKQIAEVIEFKSEFKERYEKLAVDLAVIFAEAIVLHDCSERRQTLEAMVKKALEACDARSEIFIRVRAEDAHHLESLSSDHLRIIKDDSLKEPGFVIETNLGDIDGRLSTQIEELRNCLIGFHAE
jgi:flagellar assembly protein FliH